ncbi:Negative regulator of mitotic exit [Mortierella alpina]|nr:Negative regulator of mitotic exit [Mortierella alpina]
MAYTTVDEKTLYIQGGSVVSKDTVTQFFSLDLTQPSWDTSNPPWRLLTNGEGQQSAPKTWGQSMTLSRDQQSLIVWNTFGTISIFNLATSTWAGSHPLPQNSTDWIGLKSITDPSTGYIYVPSGSNNGTSMTLYDPAKDTAVPLPSAPTTVMDVGLQYYSLVWCSLRNSMLLYGGITNPGNAPSPYLIEFQPATSTWSRISTTGVSPGNINRHCMVPAYNGTKMVVFGGTGPSGIPQGSIYVLDVKTMSWIKGAQPEARQNRTGMACTVAGDNFVVWGGDYILTAVDSFATPIIYNIKSDQWTTQFALAPPPQNAQAPPPESKKVNVAAIGGGIGAAVVAVLIGLLVYRRYRKKQAKGTYRTPSSDPHLDIYSGVDSSSTRPRCDQDGVHQQQYCLGHSGNIQTPSPRYQRESSTSFSGSNPRVNFTGADGSTLAGESGARPVSQASSQSPPPALVYAVNGNVFFYNNAQGPQIQPTNDGTAPQIQGSRNNSINIKFPSAKESNNRNYNGSDTRSSPGAKDRRPKDHGQPRRQELNPQYMSPDSQQQLRQQYEQNLYNLERLQSEQQAQLRMLEQEHESSDSSNDA